MTFSSIARLKKIASLSKEAKLPRYVQNLSDALGYTRSFMKDPTSNAYLDMKPNEKMLRKLLGSEAEGKDLDQLVEMAKGKLDDINAEYTTLRIRGDDRKSQQQVAENTPLPISSFKTRKEKRNTKRVLDQLEPRENRGIARRRIIQEKLPTGRSANIEDPTDSRMMFNDIFGEVDSGDVRGFLAREAALKKRMGDAYSGGEERARAFRKRLDEAEKYQQRRKYVRSPDRTPDARGERFEGLFASPNRRKFRTNKERDKVIQERGMLGVRAVPENPNAGQLKGYIKRNVKDPERKKELLDRLTEQQQFARQRGVEFKPTRDLVFGAEASARGVPRNTQGDYVKLRMEGKSGEELVDATNLRKSERILEEDRVDLEKFRQNPVASEDEMKAVMKAAKDFEADETFAKYRKGSDAASEAIIQHFQKPESLAQYRKTGTFPKPDEGTVKKYESLNPKNFGTPKRIRTLVDRMDGPRKPQTQSNPPKGLPDLQKAPKPQPKSQPSPQPKPQVKPQPKPQPKPQVEPQPKPESAPQPKPESAPQPKPESAPQPKPKVESQPKPEVESQPKPEVESQPSKSETGGNLKTVALGLGVPLAAGGAFMAMKPKNKEEAQVQQTKAAAFEDELMRIVYERGIVKEAAIPEFIAGLGKKTTIFGGAKKPGFFKNLFKGKKPSTPKTTPSPSGPQVTDGPGIGSAPPKRPRPDPTTAKPNPNNPGYQGADKPVPQQPVPQQPAPQQPAPQPQQRSVNLSDQEIADAAADLQKSAPKSRQAEAKIQQQQVVDPVQNNSQMVLASDVPQQIGEDQIRGTFNRFFTDAGKMTGILGKADESALMRAGRLAATGTVGAGSIYAGSQLMGGNQQQQQQITKAAGLAFYDELEKLLKG